MIGFREHAIAALGFERNTLAFDQLHEPDIIQLRKRRIQESRIAEHVAQKLFPIGCIGDVTASFSGNINLFAQLFIPFEQNDLRSGTRGVNRSHHSRSAAADYDDFLRHIILPSSRGKRHICPISAPCPRSIRKPRGGGAVRAQRSVR